jgi:hypothetical protein
MLIGEKLLTFRRVMALLIPFPASIETDWLTLTSVTVVPVKMAEYYSRLDPQQNRKQPAETQS